MRITYRMSTSNYISNLNNLSSDVTDLNNQVASGRKYDRTSEDVSSAVRGYQIRRNLAKVEGYQNNISHAQDFLTNTESTLGQIEDSLSEASDKILQAMNGPQSSEERAIIGKELNSIQDQLLATLNTKVSDAYIFGGSNTEKAPFTIVGGKLFYNDKSLDTLSDTEANKLSDDKLYVDIGLGIGLNADDTIKRNTVFEYSVTGISFVGHGVAQVQDTNPDGSLKFDPGDGITPIYKDQTVKIDGTDQPISNNVFNLIGQIADALTQKDYSFDTVDTLLGEFKTAMQGSFQTMTEIGSKTNYLDFMTSRYETQDYNLQKRQTSVEGIDAAYTYIEYQTQMVAYKAALQMGQSVIQQSVFDYMS